MHIQFPSGARLVAPALVLCAVSTAACGTTRAEAAPAATAPPETAVNAPPAADTTDAPALGSAIFLHPDGASPSHWGAARLVTVGPDGLLAWDRLEHVGLYRGHLTNSVASSSHGGATVHAYGVKVPYDSYGMRGQEPLTSLSGKPHGIMTEAVEAGLATALINSGHLAEPGTGVFVASAPSRGDVEEITRQVIESGVDIILGGGEVLLLPEGERGVFGFPGVRRDGRNLIDRARELGYEVVYTREELLALPDDTERVLGIFSASQTFNDRSEQVLLDSGLPFYVRTAPTIGEMTAKALRMLETRDARFFMVAEEEGSDNFANQNNAAGTLEALTRADAAFAAALDHLEREPGTLLITAADSDAGGMEVWPVRDPTAFNQPLPANAENGAPIDGVTGARGLPFVAQADDAGVELRFGIAWAAHADVMGGIVARAHGLNAELLPPAVDNTDIYRMLYATLFGRWLP